ncbi:MAG: hypothetical protein PWQ28_100 [Candidatus Woesearchaeota archaeon]|nr:hypothetical protein [Candidatus Woesearchaeota archaeon]
MFFLKDLFKFYIRSDWVKASGLILLGIVAGATPNLIQLLSETGLYIGIVAASLLLCHARLINDFYDAKKCNEQNNLTHYVEVLGEKFVFFLVNVPLIFAIILFLLIRIRILSFMLFALFVFFSVVYSAPKKRLRDNWILGFVLNPLLAELIFMASFLIYGEINNSFFVLSAGVLSFYFISELVHELSHLEKDKGTGRVTLVMKIGKDKIAKFLSGLWRIYPLLILISFFLYFVDFKIAVLFSIFSVFNIWRFFKLKEIDSEKNLECLRSSLLGKTEILLYIFYFIILSIVY